MNNILCIYNETQTYTNTVFEHINAFQTYSCHRWFFVHQDPQAGINIDLSRFDVVIIHFTVRLPFDQIAENTAKALSEYKGLKALFIQDEYDHTRRAWHWIKRLGIQLVFTVVPTEGITRIYPPEELPGVRFVNNLTGYVPEILHSEASVQPSGRSLIVGYRGRPLPTRYGALAQEKVEIGRLVKEYCVHHEIAQNIAWAEHDRIYGPKWYDFMASCRAMLGSESGSNVFDWDGTLASKIDIFRRENREASEMDIYTSLVKPLEIPGIMNQVSPRIFEAIASRTVLVLFEGVYSNVVTAGTHYIPVRKDGSNLDEVFQLLHDGDFVDTMADNAYRDVIASGTYSYQTFAHMVDSHIAVALSLIPTTEKNARPTAAAISLTKPSPITTTPLRAEPAIAPGPIYTWSFRNYLKYGAACLWSWLPERLRNCLKPWLKKLLKRD